MNLVLLKQPLDGDVTVLDLLLEPFLRPTNVALIRALLVDDEDSRAHA